MGKRIVIVSSMEKNRKELGMFIEDYFKEKFLEYVRDLSIEGYSALNEPPTEKQIGHKYEILVVLDRRLCPREGARDKRGKLYDKFTELSLIETKRLCDLNEIPYIPYRGEFERKQEAGLLMLLEGASKKIYNRFNSFESDYF